MSLREILLMVLIISEKSIIREKKISSFHRLGFIKMIYKKSHAQPEILSSCHEVENILCFPKNRRIPEIIRSLTLILQGGIAYFLVFSIRFRISLKIARNEKKSITLPDLKRDSGFSEKSIIWPNNLMCFHGTVRNRMFSEKSLILNRE